MNDIQFACFILMFKTLALPHTYISYYGGGLHFVYLSIEYKTYLKKEYDTSNLMKDIRKFFKVQYIENLGVLLLPKDNFDYERLLITKHKL